MKPMVKASETPQRSRVLHQAIRLVAFLPLCMGVIGCAGLPKGVLAPVQATVPGASQVNLLVATTRAPASDPAVLFSGERGQGLHATEITVSIPPAENRQVGQVQWPKRLPPDPSTEFATTKVRTLSDLGEVRGWLKQHLPRNRRVLIFVHGFNNRYEDAVYRFAQIVHDSHADVAPILFTWPSRANVLDYAYDRESTNYSRTQLEEVLRRAAQDPSVGDVTIMAHSMGSWLVTEALRQMAIRDGRVAPKIRNVILASPDLDIDVFRRQSQELGPSRPKLTLFVSQDDQALERVAPYRRRRRSTRPDQSGGRALSVRTGEGRGDGSRPDGAQERRSPQPRQVRGKSRGSPGCSASGSWPGRRSPMSKIGVGGD